MLDKTTNKTIQAGEDIRLLVEEFNNRHEECIAHEWKGGVLKRLLIGVGVLTGSGIVGGGVYLLKKFGEQPRNTTHGYYDGATYNRSVRDERVSAVLVEYFGNHVLHNDRKKIRTKNIRRHVIQQNTIATTIPKQPDDVKIEKLIESNIPYLNVRTPMWLVSRSYPYTYTNDQPGKCKTSMQERKCKYAHSDGMRSGIKYTKLILNVGNTPCLCPPPDGANCKIIPPSPDEKSIIYSGLNGKVSVPPPSIPISPISTQEVIMDSIHDTVHDTVHATYVTHDKEGVFIKKRIFIDIKTSTDRPIEKDDYIKIEKMYDFSCVEERENLSWGKIFHQIGKTLIRPISSLAEEAQVVHYYNTLNLGCPKNENTRRMTSILDKVDEFITLIMGLYPGSNLLIFMQRFVGPLLEEMGSQMEGEPTDMQRIEDIHMQLLISFQDTMRVHVHGERSEFQKIIKKPGDRKIGNVKCLEYRLVKRGLGSFTDCFRRRKKGGIMKVLPLQKKRIKNEENIEQSQMVSNECDNIIKIWDDMDSFREESIGTLEYIVSQMHEDEVPILNEYNENGSYGINTYLRYGVDINNEYQSNANELALVYQRLNAYEGFSYRVLRLPADRISSFKDGDVIVDRGFSSSSALIENSRDWLDDEYIMENSKPDDEYVLIVYGQNVPKKIAGNDFLPDHILINAGQKLEINKITSFEYQVNKENLEGSGLRKVNIIGVSRYEGPKIASDIYSGQKED